MFLAFTYLSIVILLAIIKPRIFIYYYFLLTYITPVVTTYIIKLDEPQYYIAKIGFIPINYFNELILLIMSVIFSINILLETKKFNSIIFKKFINFTAIYILIMLSIKLIKSTIYLDIESQLTSVASVFVLPALVINILCLFSNKQIKKLFNQFFYFFTLIFILFIFYSLIPYLEGLNFSINYNKRLEHFLFLGANGTAAILGMFFFILLTKFKNQKNVLLKPFFLVILILISVSIFFTFTRAIFLAFVLIIFLELILFKKNNINKALMLFVLFVLIFLYSSLLLDVFSRGEGEVLSQVDSSSTDSISYRIYSVWLPTIFEIFSSFIYFLIGTEDNGFNEFLNRIVGINDSNHNFIIFHLVSTGFIGVIIVLMFWKNLFYSYYKLISSRIVFKVKTIIKLCGYSLFIFFISLNVMSSYNSFFIIFASVAICYSIVLSQDLQHKLASKNILIQK